MSGGSGKARISLPPRALLLEVFRYDEKTGELWHRKRFPRHFEDSTVRSAHQKANTWNSIYSGKLAGKISPSSPYRLVGIGRSVYRCHRIIYKMVTGLEPREIDHIDGDKTNNRMNNLRPVSSMENARNQKVRSTNKSGCMGVSKRPDTNKWIARINDGKGRIFLGTFSTREEAVAARKLAEREYGYHENHGRSS